MISPVVGEIVEWKSLMNGERMIRGVVVKRLSEDRVLVRDYAIPYPQVIATERLRRARGVPTICGPGRVA